jgi:hypothetical protein
MGFAEEIHKDRGICQRRVEELPASLESVWLEQGREQPGGVNR